MFRFGEEVMETVASWTARICVAVAAGLPCDPINGFALPPRGLSDISAGGSMALELANWNVLDIGTGNGLFLHALFKQGYVLQHIPFPNFVVPVSFTGLTITHNG
jgi:hypothetical protein